MAVASGIRLWSSSNDRITLEYAQARAIYLEIGERIRDRNGLIHRIAPASNRYPTSLILSILPEELLNSSEGTGPLKPTVVEWLELHFRQQSPLIVQVRGETIDRLGRALRRCLAYRAIIDRLPEAGLASLPPGLEVGEWVEMELTVLEDGTFINYEQPDFQAYEPARP